MLGTQVHMYTKYEVSTSNPCQGEVCTDDDANDAGCQLQWTMHDCIRLFG